MSRSSSNSSNSTRTRRHSAVDIEVDQQDAYGDDVDVVPVDAPTPTAPSDAASFVAAALAKLPPDVRALAEDPKRKAHSKDPGWKYSFWPDMSKKDWIECIFCSDRNHGGIKRFKQHLAGGYGDVVKCGKAPAIIRLEMQNYLAKNSRKSPIPVEEGGEGEAAEDGADVVVVAAATEANSAVAHPSSGTAAKRKQSLMASFVVKGHPQNHSKTVASMLCKTPEKVVSERHSSKTTQPTIVHCTKKSKEAKQIVDDHVADFFYENGLPLNAINSRSWEIMLESIGQYGPGYRSPSYHEIRNPLLDRAMDKTMQLRERHEKAWQEYGCTLMSDGWTDTSHRHLINFLVNSPAGTFFLGSVDTSSQIADAHMLAKLLEEQIDKVGKENVVQVITDNGSNFKAAGRILMEKIPTLFWTPCAAHCLDLMLEDIGKITSFSSCINKAKMVSRFIYKHGRILDAMRARIGGDLVRPAVTRFATSFLTLASMYKHKQGLRSLFVSEDWHENRLSIQAEGRRVENIMFSMDFWTDMENCLRASQPLLIALRLVDGDERPAVAEISAAMDTAKNSIKEALAHKPGLLKEVLGYFDKRWENQMEQKLYGAALFLNPSKFFAIRENNKREASRLRSMFNDVLWKMEPDDDTQSKISKQANDYERSEGESFSKPTVIKDREKKSPILWWSAYGGLTFELQSLAKRIISLCCSASGCERNWSTFAHIHTKKRNRLEHKRLNKLAFVSYNRKMANRFQKLRELGSKGKTYNPLVLEEFQWENEWVDINCDPVHQGYASAAAAPGSDDLTWADVDRAMSASQNLRGGRNVPRAARGDVIKSTSTNQQTQITYTKRKKRSRIATGDEDNNEHDDGGGNDPSLVEAELLAEDEEMDDQEEDEAATASASSGEGGGPGGFQLDDALDV